MAQGLFNLITILPLPIWLGMLLFPRARFTERLVLAYWPYIVLGGVYTLLLLIALTTGSGSFDLSFNALRQSFSQEWTFLAGWAHYIALDLFVGVWIFRDAKYLGRQPAPVRFADAFLRTARFSELSVHTCASASRKMTRCGC